MSPGLRRAVAFAAVATLALAAPALGRAMALPFAAVAVGAFAVTDGRLFELFADAGDREEGRLRGLLSFSLAATGLGLLASVFGMPAGVFVATVLLVGYGHLAREALGGPGENAGSATRFGAGGFVAAAAGLVAVRVLDGSPVGADLPTVAFLAVTGALLAALLDAVFVERDDPLVMVSVALALWLLADLSPSVAWAELAVALGTTAVFGYLALALDASSVSGVFTGANVCLLAAVLGGYGWFAVLISFFVVGGLATKFRYEEKERRGVAEPKGGARGSGNVLGNSTVALVALLLFAAGPRLGVDGAVFRFAFAGSVATALADTLSSEVGGLFDGTRLITSLEPVEPGTDGAVTWQGEVAGLAGAGLVGGLSVGLLGLSPAGAAVVAAAGFLGMTADSLVGATVEGGSVGNQTVNFLATVAGAGAGVGLALALGVVGL